MWGFTAKNRLKIALLLFTVLSLLLLTNLQERRMINSINERVVSIYEDRVVVGDYILTLSNMTQNVIKIIKEHPTDHNHKFSHLLGEINSVNNLYQKTYLTDVEKSTFDQFLRYCEQIEEYYLSANYDLALESSLEAEKILTKLSTIQVEEGKILLDDVLNLTGTGSFLAYIEIVVLIVIAILIQWIVLSSKPLISRTSIKDHQMN